MEQTKDLNDYLNAAREALDALELNALQVLRETNRLLATARVAKPLEPTKPPTVLIAPPLENTFERVRVSEIYLPSEIGRDRWPALTSALQKAWEAAKCRFPLRAAISPQKREDRMLGVLRLKGPATWCARLKVSHSVEFRFWTDHLDEARAASDLVRRLTQGAHVPLNILCPDTCDAILQEIRDNA